MSEHAERLTGAVTVGKKGTFVSGGEGKRLQAALLDDETVEEMEAAADDSDR